MFNTYKNRAYSIVCTYLSISIMEMHSQTLSWDGLNNGVQQPVCAACSACANRVSQRDLVAAHF